MTSTECYDLIKRGVDIEVPGLEVYYDKVVSELRGLFSANRVWILCGWCVVCWIVCEKFWRSFVSLDFPLLFGAWR